MLTELFCSQERNLFCETQRKDDAATFPQTFVLLPDVRVYFWSFV